MCVSFSVSRRSRRSRGARLAARRSREKQHSHTAGVFPSEESSANNKQSKNGAQGAEHQYENSAHGKRADPHISGFFLSLIFIFVRALFLHSLYYDTSNFVLEKFHLQNTTDKNCQQKSIKDKTGRRVNVSTRHVTFRDKWPQGHLRTYAEEKFKNEYALVLTVKAHESWPPDPLLFNKRTSHEFEAFQRKSSIVTFTLKIRKVMFWSPCIYLFVCVLLAQVKKY